MSYPRSGNFHRLAMQWKLNARTFLARKFPNLWYWHCSIHCTLNMCFGG